MTILTLTQELDDTQVIIQFAIARGLEIPGEFLQTVMEADAMLATAAILLRKDKRIVSIYQVHYAAESHLIMSIGTSASGL